ncbi:MAG TPA: GNAT family N-acetyltransferase [Pelagibacterium sp.]|uniref:GNAT family N-acetyltransferase n=1 Tax=Pelagibacterium sp. TaxID=1967288 RepID=UPI002C44BE9A|nr:GNAT family N-acetyltransferase [Pelagibacterium sp.]HWJ86912.1 GNAT family N-acetyltransferase [Pelagibacterium sp.]
MPLRHIETLADDAHAFAYVAGSFELGRALGFFPKDRAGPSGGEQCILAESEFGVPVGFVTFYRADHPNYVGCVWIDLVWVEKTHRRMGVGRAMLERAIAVAESDPEVTRVELGTLSHNMRMQNLARRVGMQASRIDFVREVHRG